MIGKWILRTVETETGDDMSSELLDISKITLDARLQCREKVDMQTAEEYAAVLKDFLKLDGPLPKVVKVGKKYLLADGWHRWHAHSIAGAELMECDVIEGTFHDALRIACSANATHGKPRTVADKRRAVVAFLEHDDANDKSTRAIADACRVSRGFAEQVRTEWEKATSKERPETVESKDGSQTHPSTKKNKPKPEQDDPDEAESDGPSQPKPDVLRDAKGRPVPDELVAVFSKLDWFESSVRELTRLAAEIEKQSQEPQGAFLAVQSAKINVKNLQGSISPSRPYVVCPACDGTKREGGHPTGGPCLVCRAVGVPQGWIPHSRWSQLTKELQTIAESYSEGA